MLLNIRKNILKMSISLLVLFFLCSSVVVNKANAQARSITGKVTDAQTGEPMPYVTISVKLTNGARKATATDFDGLYTLYIPKNIATDSVYASYISYLPSKKLLPTSNTGEVNFQLSVNSKTLKVVNITPKTYV